MAGGLAAPTVLRRGEIELRPVDAGVVELLVAGSLDPGVTRWTQIPADLTISDAGMVTAGWSFPSDRVVRYQVCVGDAPPAGMVSIWLDAAGMAEVGYWLLEEARGRGVGGIAVELLCDWAFHECALEELQLTTLPGNLPSEAVARRCGFVADGFTRRSVKGEQRRLRVWRRRRDTTSDARASGT